MIGTGVSFVGTDLGLMRLGYRRLHSCVAVDFKSAEQWEVILGLWVALLDRVVAGNDDTLGANHTAGAFGLHGEGVVVGPLLHVLATNLVGAHLINDDSFLVGVAFPPLGVVLEVGVGPFGATMTSLACACSSDVPLILEHVKRGEGVGFLAEDVFGSLDVGNFLEVDEAFLDCVS